MIITRKLFFLLMGVVSLILTPPMLCAMDIDNDSDTEMDVAGSESDREEEGKEESLENTDDDARQFAIMADMLKYAQTRERREILLENWLEISSLGDEDSEGHTLLSYVMDRDDTGDICLQLIEKGSRGDNNMYSPKGKWLLHWALDIGNVGLVDRVLRANLTDLSEEAGGYGDVITEAVYSNNIDILSMVGEYLYWDESRINNQESLGLTPLIAAVERKNIEMIKLLIARGADVNKAGIESDGIENEDESVEGITPLTMAARHNQKKIIGQLVFAGADVKNTLDRDDVSAEMKEVVQECAHAKECLDTNEWWDTYLEPQLNIQILPSALNQIVVEYLEPSQAQDIVEACIMEQLTSTQAQAAE